jgi:hypothetical protein
MRDFLMSLGEWLEHSPLSSAVANWPYIFVIIVVAHYFSIFLLIGTSVVIDVRLLGLAGRHRKTAPFAEQLFPWTWTALAVAVLSGFLIFALSAASLFAIPYFYLKLLTILLSAIFILIIQRNVRNWDQFPITPMGGKLTAIVSLVLWLGALISAVQIGYSGL